jgi:hypothetical protein
MPKSPGFSNLKQICAGGPNTLPSTPRIRLLLGTIDAKTAPAAAAESKTTHIYTSTASAGHYDKVQGLLCLDKQILYHAMVSMLFYLTIKCF